MKKTLLGLILLSCFTCVSVNAASNNLKPYQLAKPLIFPPISEFSNPVAESYQYTLSVEKEDNGKNSLIYKFSGVGIVGQPILVSTIKEIPYIKKCSSRSDNEKLVCSQDVLKTGLDYKITIGSYGAYNKAPYNASLQVGYADLLSLSNYSTSEKSVQMPEVKYINIWQNFIYQSNSETLVFKSFEHNNSDIYVFTLNIEPTK